MIEAGKILTLAWGCYSDKVNIGPFRALKAIDCDALTAEYIREWRSKDSEVRPDYYDEDDEPRCDEFCAWLAKHGYIEDIGDAEYWFLGDYTLSDWRPGRRA